MFVIVLATAAQSASGTTVTPISKVLELLQGMLEKGKAEKEAEVVSFAAFSQWCSGTTRIKTNEISTAGEHKEMLEAKIGQAEVRSRSLSDRVAELGADVARWEKDKKSITAVRDKEAADYKATATDYAESLDAIDGAITVLRKQAFSRPQAEAALVQLQGLRLMPAAATKALAAFLQQSQVPDEQLLISPPEAHGYEFQSGGVIDMLEKLKDEFATKKYELDQEEMNSKNAFEQMLQQLAENEIEAERLREGQLEQQEARAAEAQEELKNNENLAESAENQLRTGEMHYDTELSRIQEQISEATADRDSWKEKVRTASQNAKALQEQLDGLQDEVKHLTGKLSTLEADNTSQGSKNLEMEQLIDEMKKKPNCTVS